MLLCGRVLTLQGDLRSGRSACGLQLRISRHVCIYTCMHTYMHAFPANGEMQFSVEIWNAQASDI